MGRRRGQRRWVIALSVAALIAPLAGVFHLADAAEGEPREGHFSPPDLPATATTASTTASGAPGFYQTSEYMIGSVAVSVILPESDGSIDSELSDWSPEQRQRVLDEVRAGLEWWSRLAPEANLTFVVEDHATQPIPTGYEPISRPQYQEGYWIGDVLARLGYSSGSYWTRVRQYANDLRAGYHTDWAFTIFVVNSNGDPDAAFADRYFAYAYLGGPFLVMTYDNAGYGIGNMDAVTAHETGHIFRALDQYASANIACGARSGYLGVETQNSQRGCALDEPSIMRGGIYPYMANSIDPYARGQVGWRDSDGDSIFDPVDTTPALSVESANEAGGEWTISGRAIDVPFPSPSRPAATINDVQVEYRINGGEWLAAQPSDGRFDSPDEAFTLTLHPTDSGNHRMTLRARNSVGNTSESAQYTVVVLDPLDGGLDTWLEPPPAGLPGDAHASAMSGLATSYHADGTFAAAIMGVEYRVDGGDWQAAQPQDGAFDSAEEGFTIELNLRGGEHVIEARAIDADGRIEQNVAALQVTVNYAVFVPLVQK